MNKQLIATKGRARQRTLTLARKAGVEVRAVVFTRKELIEALGYDPGRKYGTKRDSCLGRCWQNSKIIWLALPVSLETIAHELAHLVTKVNHNTRAFNDKVMAVKRGLAPARHKPGDFDITVTSHYVVRALTVNEAKHSISKRLYYTRNETTEITGHRMEVAK